MTITDPLMLQETREAPQVIARQFRENAALSQALASALRERRPAYAVTVARGSSDHACTFLKYALETQLALLRVPHLRCQPICNF